MKRAIEESFPIVEINRLAVPKRNAFKPIYQMHKWFARRASCVFRAILLASMKPASTDIMAEFYKDHTDDPETNGVKVLDPFMGGGTTVVEALRLGCDVTGIDLNPVAWFIVKTEVEPVDVDELKSAFKRLEERPTASGKSVKEELLSHYKTECPCCGKDNPLNPPLSKGEAEEGNSPLEKGGTGGCADIIYTFWVKSAICTNPTCKKEVPLFGDYIICRKSPTIRFVPDYQCRSCGKHFDLDIEPASLIAEKSLTVSNGYSSGEGRSNKRWALLDRFTNKYSCPWCMKENAEDIETLKSSKKKVPLNVLLCPHCYAVWQYRGTLPEDVSCPVCRKEYNPNKGNTSKGEFVCASCGTRDKVISSIRKLPQEQLHPTKLYALEGYCSKCAGNGDEKNLYGDTTKSKTASHSCNINKNNGKFFKKIDPADLKRYQDAEKRWEKEKEALPHPKSKVPVGEKTKSGLIAHHYLYWHQMFNPRQLLCLSTLLKAIGEEEDQVLKEMVLSGFFNALNNMSDFTSYIWQPDCTRQVFARHDYAPKNTSCESTVWGADTGMGSFNTYIDAIFNGKEYSQQAWDYYKGSDGNKKIENDNLKGRQELLCFSSACLSGSGTFDMVVTDPPYAGNVNYAELADFFYVWLRLLLSITYSQFSPEVAPKVEEIIENPTRGKTVKDYEDGLTEVWKKCHEKLDDNGVMVFTFHHAEGSAWESLLESLCNAGFVIEAIYPIHGEAESSLHLQDKQAISYDLIHVCKKRTTSRLSLRGETEAISNNEIPRSARNDNSESFATKKRSWAGVRQEIRKKAREEIQMIEAGRYGSEKLAPADLNIILIGKCLELYSKHYGAIVDHNGEVVPIQQALTAIRMMVEQLITTQQPLPSELEHIDPISYVYMTCLCDRMEIQSDEVHKSTRGILEIDTLMKAGIMRKGRAKRGRTYEVKNPDERYKDLSELFRKKSRLFDQTVLFPEMEEAKFDNVALVNVVHYLMGLANASENLVPWINEFRPVMPQVRVALEYLKGRNPTFQEPINKILSLVEI
jgi:putative DNA methylase